MPPAEAAWEIKENSDLATSVISYTFVTDNIGNDIGFSVKYEDVIIGLDTLTVNDKTLWMSKITKAMETFSVTEKHFLTRQKSGLFYLFLNLHKTILISRTGI